MKYTLLLFIICISKFTFAQIPANYNLIPNSSWNYYNKWISFDSVIDNQGLYCWTYAGAYTDVFTQPAPKNFSEHANQSNVSILGNSRVINLNTGMFYYDTLLNKINDTLVAPDYRDYKQVKLIKPLVAGTTYKLTIDFAAFESTQYDFTNATFVSNFGALFTDTQVMKHYYGPNYGSNMITDAQVHFNNYTTVPDTMEYKKQTAYYKAKGGEQYVTFGNFDSLKNLIINYHPSSIYKLFSNLGVATPNSGILSSHINFANPILVEDTTLPTISLNQFSLGWDKYVCANAPITIGGDSNYFHYLWNTGDTTQFITVNQQGYYWCEADYGCGSYRDSIYLYGDYLYFDIKDTIPCKPSVLNYTVPYNNLKYLWSTGDTTQSIKLNTDGKYWVMVSDSCQSHYTDTFTIQYSSPPKQFTLGNDKTVCDDIIFLSAPIGFNYLWNTGDTSQEIYVQNNGLFICTISNTCGVISDSINIKFDKAPPINKQTILSDTNRCLSNNNTSILLQTTTNYPFIWSTGEITKSISVTTPNIYWLKEYNDCGENIDSIKINNCIENVYFPNAFTPNNGIKNNKFGPIFSDYQNIKSYTLKIYDRYGNTVFATNNPLEYWNGLNYSMDTYYYICNFIMNNNKNIIKGDVILIK